MSKANSEAARLTQLKRQEQELAHAELAPARAKQAIDEARV